MQSKQGHPWLLVLILLAHLAAVWMLARQHLVRPPIVVGKERITYLAFIPPRARETPKAAAAPTASVAPATPRRPAVVQPMANPQPSVAAAPASDSAPAPVAEPAPHRLSGAEILEQARRDMPRIERELRNGVPTRLKLSPDSLRYKLEHGIEDAYVGGDQRAVIDFYTSPDNVHYTRITKAGRVWCTMNGGPVSLRSAMGGGGGDTHVNCPPPDAGWKDMPWVN